MERGRRSSENASAAPAPVAAIHSGTLPVIVAGVRVVLSDTSVTTAAGVNSSVRSTTSPRASMTALTPLWMQLPHLTVLVEQTWTQSWLVVKLDPGW